MMYRQLAAPLIIPGKKILRLSVRIIDYTDHYLTGKTEYKYFYVFRYLLDKKIFGIKTGFKKWVIFDMMYARFDLSIRESHPELFTFAGKNFPGTAQGFGSLKSFSEDVLKCRGCEDFTFSKVKDEFYLARKFKSRNV